MEEKPTGFIRRLFRRLGALISWVRVTTLNLVFIALVIIIIAATLGGDIPSIPKQGALVLNIHGTLVDQLSYMDPVVELMGEVDPYEQETLLQDVIDAITFAKDDERINSLVIKLDYLARGGISKMQEVAVALEDFRRSGKKIIAVGDSFNQDQYFLAAQADEVIMHPMGAVMLQGYGVYRNYFKEALDRLEISFHVFRVGTYKSALEPFIRDNMSSEAKQANLTWLNQLWGEYGKQVGEHRRLTIAEINRYINEMDVALNNYGGNAATAAVAAGFIDTLKTRDELNQYLIQIVGAEDDEGYYQYTHFEQYLWLRKLETASLDKRPRVGVIVASGTISNGKQPPGAIGGDSLAALIREARRDDVIEALVLRVDSGGGSAFASEVIRQELLLLQKAGKPLVVSMGSMAASGGYWISATADKIWATPTTLTGSIGIFGAFPSFDKTLAKLGVRGDGVGTTKLSGAMRPDRPIEPIAARAMQSTIEYGYEQFLNVVATGRDMSKQQVEKMAEGRVWSGADAKRLGLVDELGGFRDAVASAAMLAGLETYQQELIEMPLSPQEEFLRQLSGVLIPSHYSSIFSPWNRLMAPFKEAAEFFQSMNDPQGVYLYCTACVAP